MKKTKIERRIENAFDAFFADENLGEGKLETFRSEANLRHERQFEDPVQKNGTVETILRQVFLFFPGTFVLYLLSLGLTASLIVGFIRPLGMNLRVGFDSVAFIFLAAALMTWLGLGDVRKPKHVVIPASIISVGIFFGAIAGVLMGVSNQFYKVISGNAFPLYILPLALIVPFLAKGWVDRDS